jgi:hypothetical protein
MARKRPRQGSFSNVINTLGYLGRRLFDCIIVRDADRYDSSEQGESRVQVGRAGAGQDLLGRKDQREGHYV